MREYEIRILKPGGGCSAIVEEIQLSDHAAIRSAQKMARGNPFEVWRALDCIYATGAPVRDRPAPMPRMPGAGHGNSRNQKIG